MLKEEINKEWQKYYYSKKINLGNPITEEHKKRFRELLDLIIKTSDKNKLSVPIFGNFWAPYYFDIEAVEKDYPCLVKVCQKINELKADVAGDKMFYKYNLLIEKLNKHLTINIGVETLSLLKVVIIIKFYFKKELLTEEIFNWQEITTLKEKWIEGFISALKKEECWAEKVYNRLQEIENKEECELYKELLNNYTVLILSKNKFKQCCESCPKRKGNKND